VLALYFPLILSVGFVILLFKANFGEKTAIQIERLGYSIKITNNFAGKFALLLASFNFIPIYLTMDFSKLYPSEFRMQVYYDGAGIEATMSGFTDGTLEALGVVRDIKKAQDYYRLLDTTRARLTGKHDLYFSSGSEFSSEGTTTFTVEKIAGIQKYRIVSAEGRLTHSLVRPDGKIEKSITLFEKVASPGDFFGPTVREIFLHRSFDIHAKFQQTIMNYSQTNGLQMDHVLIGLTSVQIWPVPGYGRTLYLFQDSSGVYVPIAYAVYY
jgi:hypothetical protein